MHSDEFVISQADPKPMYLQLMDQICQRITAGDWPTGHELPSIRSLAASVRVSVITVKRTYLELERQGVIVTRPGRGSFVAAGAGLGLRLRREELEEHLKAVADLSLLLSMSVEDIAERLRTLRADDEHKAAAPAEEGADAGSSDERNGDKQVYRRLGGRR
jgi:GntR family transcriptional regulator